MGRNFIRWRPLTKGTQVILACQSGELAQAAIVGMLYTQALDAPSTSPEIDMIQWNDGASIFCQLGTGEMTIRAKDDLRIESGGDIHINAQKVRVFE
uniref:Phage baseplate assembly protein V n=1 Tax=Candidatus Kentrum sp. TC TaxID=2126339 RepID=A0A450Z2A7_9GAMM|nr:MAG: phage baseplate assembly protein V [Candidatus Kentron sp. TC]